MPESNGPDTGGRGSKPVSEFESFGDRFRFKIELRPSETTTVSWKKLLKEANVTNGDSRGGGNGPGSLGVENQQLSFPLHPPVGKPRQADGEPQDPAGTNRLSSVIERIERMYAGNDGSSDEEDVVLGDVRDDDEYDTEDSFIDDAELDDYFQVDKSKLKHDGFFINRGKLERIEPPPSAIQQPKKRRHKDAIKGDGGNDDANNAPKKVKSGNKSQKSSSLIERNLTSQPRGTPMTSIHEASAANVAEIAVKKKRIEAKVALDSSEKLNRDHARVEKDAHKQIVRPSKNSSSRSKEGGKLQDILTQKSIEKTSSLYKSHPGRQSDHVGKMKQHIQHKEKSSPVGKFDLNVPATPSRNSQEFLKDLVLPRKEGSYMKQRSAMLEKAIRELEKTVNESRPASAEVQISDNTSQAVKRRLTPEIKQKLAKVARLSYTGDGKISMEVLNRLMGIVGHLMQLRALRRNIKNMANMELSVKQAKDDQLQKMKLEVAEMVAQRIEHMNSILQKQTPNSDPFQEIPLRGMESAIRKYTMDETLGNKICDLYDLYIEKLEEDSGPPVKRLYEELAAFWPNGVMDNNGIKNAIYRAKKRKLQSNQPKNQEIPKKEKPTLKPEDSSSRGKEAAKTALKSTNVRDKVTSDPRSQSSHGGTSHFLGLSASNSLVPSLFLSPNIDSRPNKQEKRKGSSSTHSSIDGMNSDEDLPKRKLKKKKPNSEVAGEYSRFRHENSSQERIKHRSDAITAPISKH